MSVYLRFTFDVLYDDVPQHDVAYPGCETPADRARYDAELFQRGYLDWPVLLEDAINRIKRPMLTGAPESIQGLLRDLRDALT